MALTRSSPFAKLLVVALALAGLELAARTLVAFVPSLQPPPPRIDLGRDLNASGLGEILRPDRDLLFTAAPSVDAEFTRHDAFDAIERFRVRTNDRGFRTPPFADAKAAGVTRVVALGESTTFGAFVEDDQSYPRQLAARLDAAAPGRFEVINLAVPGYSSRQGIELLRRQVLALRPDIVLFAFGHADRNLRALESDDARIQGEETGIVAILNGLAALGDRLILLQLADRLFGGEEMPHALEGVPRGSPEDLTAAIIAAQREVQAAGGRLVVLNTDFAGSDAAEAIRTGVQRSGAEYVDLVGALDAITRERSVQLARQHRLEPLPPQPGRMTFRVEAPQHLEVWLEPVRDGKSLLIPMRDDGRGEDQVAGDSIFTAELSGRPGERLSYTYRAATVLGPVREFTRGSQRNRNVRQQRFDPSRAPIDRFGVVPYRAAPALPDAEGHATIAQVLAAHLLAPPASAPAPAAAADAHTAPTAAATPVP